MARFAEMAFSVAPFVRGLVMLASPFLSLWDWLSNTISCLLSYLLIPFGGPFPLPSQKPGTDCIRCVLVTGTSAGLGREIALRLARQGFTVFAGVRKESDGTSLLKEYATTEKNLSKTRKGLREPLVKDVQQTHKAIVPVLLDVTDKSAIAKARNDVELYLRSHNALLAGIVNNAGIIDIAPLEIAADHEIRREFDVNFFGVIDLCKAFIPLLKQSKGRIVNIGSAAGFIAVPSTGIYSASKAAVGIATEALRMELRPFGVGVSLIEPGCIRSRAWDVGLEQIKSYNKPSTRAPKGQSGISSEGDFVDPAANTDARTISEYRPLFKRFEFLFSSAYVLAFPPKHVAYQVEHALTSRYPRSRYLAGADAKIGMVLFTYLLADCKTVNQLLPFLFCADRFVSSQSSVEVYESKYVSPAQRIRNPVMKNWGAASYEDASLPFTPRPSKYHGRLS